MIERSPFLKKLEAITRLTDPEVREAISLCEDTRTISQNQDIVRIDECPLHVHIILSGWAARYSIRKNGTRQFTALLLPGDFCDIQALAVARYDHSIVALTECQVAYADKDAMAAVALAPSALSRALLRSTLIDEAILRRWIVNIASGDAQTTLSHLFCELHLRMRAVGLVDNESFSVPLTQEQLADAVGMTTVHVNRVLQRMRADKLIEFRRGRVSITNVAQLRKQCGFDPNYLHLLTANSAA